MTKSENNLEDALSLSPKPQLGGFTKAMDPGRADPSWRSGNDCVTGGVPPIASEPTPSPRLWAAMPGATPTSLCEYYDEGFSMPFKLGTFYLAGNRNFLLGSDTPGTGLRASINVTPMIDVLLVLLIVFMAIAPQRAVGFEAMTPPAQHNGAPEGQENPIVLEIAADGSYRLNTVPIAGASLGERLAAIYARRAERVLFVRAAPDLEFRIVAGAIDIAHGAAVDRIALMPR